MIYCIFILSLVGCASKKIQLVSEPPSTVFVSSDLSSEFTEIGKTPLDIVLKDHASNDKFTYLAFKAEGYDSYRVVLPSAYSTGTVEIKLNENEKVKDIEERMSASFNAQMSVLKDQVLQQRQIHAEEKDQQRQIHAEEKDQLEEDFKTRASETFHKVMEVQNALHMKSLSKAGRALAELRVLNAPPGLILTLEGNFEFISGRPKRALASYRRALDIDPTNVELAAILKELKRVVR